MSLVKNTNTIHIVVAQVNQSGGPITKALTEKTFECAIYDDNGYMNYDNSLLEDNLLTYKPYNIQSEMVTTMLLAQLVNLQKNTMGLAVI